MTSNSHIFHRLVACGFVAFVFVLFVGLVLVSGAAAQTGTNSANETTPDSTEITEQLGDLQIHSYDFEQNSDGEGGTFTVDMTWNGTAPEQVTLTEMIELDSEGSTQISFQQQRIAPDSRLTVEMDAEVRSGGTAAIMITTTQSVNNGNAVVLQDGDPESRPAIRFQNVILAMGITSSLTALGAFVFVLRRKHAEEYGKERIA